MEIKIYRFTHNDSDQRIGNLANGSEPNSITESLWPENNNRMLGLTRDQVDLYDPPANPAKTTDPRYAAYRAEHGTESWELDALSPEVLDQLARDEVEAELDAALWKRALAKEKASRARITKLVGRGG